MTRTVLLIDDHELIRQGLCRAFERSGDFTVLGEAGNIADGVSLVQGLHPDVVVIDVRLPDGSGLDATKQLRRAWPDLGIVVLTMYSADDQLFLALDAGASAFVLKDAHSDDVVAAARHASVSPHSFAAKDLAAALRRRNTPSGPQLSGREREVLDLLASGLGVAAIARTLFISESTIKTHISKLYEKLGASNRAQAIMRAVHSGLISHEASTNVGHK